MISFGNVADGPGGGGSVGGLAAAVAKGQAHAAEEDGAEEEDLGCLPKGDLTASGDVGQGSIPQPTGEEEKQGDEADDEKNGGEEVDDPRVGGGVGDGVVDAEVHWGG